MRKTRGVGERGRATRRRDGDTEAVNHKAAQIQGLSV